MNLAELEKTSKHEQVVQLLKKGEFDKALSICLSLLDVDPNDSAALFQLAKIMNEQGNRGLAYNIMARAVKLRPDIPEMWLQYGQTHGETPEEWNKAEWCFRKAIKAADKIGKQMPIALACIGTIEYLQGHYDEALRLCDEAIAIKHDVGVADNTKALSHLAKHEWVLGWHHYSSLIGTKRMQCAYGDEPEWDGTPGKRLIISGEQGLGDEIMYASCFNDVIANNQHVVIECIPRLEGLFKRSFPDAAAVYGSRWEKDVVWEQDHKPDAHVAMATLPKFYRNRDDDFPGDAYLVPHPDMVEAVQGLLSKLGHNPKVGIAWTGGSGRTRGHLRTRTLDELTPLLRIPGIDWISLEYQNRDEEIGQYYERRKIPIHTYHWLTAKGLDYDLTAALISELDLVISVPTTGVQMAGALGVECWCIVPKNTGWMFAQTTYPWASSVQALRNPSVKLLEGRMQEWLEVKQPKVA